MYCIFILFFTVLCIFKVIYTPLWTNLFTKEISQNYWPAPYSQPYRPEFWMWSFEFSNLVEKCAICIWQYVYDFFHILKTKQNKKCKTFVGIFVKDDKVFLHQATDSNLEKKTTCPFRSIPTNILLFLFCQGFNKYLNISIYFPKSIYIYILWSRSWLRFT